MSRNRNASLHGATARCGKLIGIGALASLLVLSAAHAQTKGGGQGEATADRGLRLLTLAPVPPSPDNTTAGAMYVFDISYVDQTVPNQTYYLADRSNRAVQVVDAVGN